MAELLKAYPKDLRLVFFHNPLSFHKKAMLASEAAHEAFVQKGAEGFWKFHDMVFADQRNIGRSDLEAHAQKLGLDMAKFKTALDKGTHRPAIKAMQAVATRLGASGTPAYFINGRFLSGARKLPTFKKLVDEELGKAKKLMADKKLARDKVYPHIMKTALTRVK